MSLPPGSTPAWRSQLEDPPPSLSDSTLLVHPNRALAQRLVERTNAEAQRVAAAEASAANPSATGGAAITPVQGEGTSPTDQGTGTQRVALSRVWYRVPPTLPSVDSAPKNTRFYGTVRVKPERYVRDISRLHQEVIQHLAAPEGAASWRSRSRSARSSGMAILTTRSLALSQRTLAPCSF